MGISFTGFKAIAILLTSMMVQSFSELVVARHPPTKNGLEKKLTYVSKNDGLALIWNNEMGKEQQFIFESITKASTITMRKEQSSFPPDELLWPKINFQELSYTKNKRDAVSDARPPECFQVTTEKTSLTADFNRKRMNCERFLHTSYTVSISQKSTEDGSISALDVELPYMIEDLNPDTEYKVEIASLNFGIPYTEVVRTLKAGPGKVQALRVTYLSQDEARLRWYPPLRLNEGITKYIVTLKRKLLLGCDERAEATPDEKENAHDVAGEKLSVILKGLHGYAKYRATVTAYTFEAGKETSIEFITNQTTIPTSVVSDLEFDEKRQRLAWNKPNCTTITGTTWGTRLNFIDLSNPKRIVSTKDTEETEFDISKLLLIPFTTYEVCVQVIRQQSQSMNISQCTKTRLTTAPVAPPAVRNLTIYDADPDANSISLRWKPPHPPYGKTEFYHLSIEKEKDPAKYMTIKASEMKCEMWEDYVCFENFELWRDTSIRTKVQVYATNEDVKERGNLTKLVFIPDDYYNEKPGSPLNFTATLRSTGDVILEWNAPLFTATKITQFRIHVHTDKEVLLGKKYSNFPMLVSYRYVKNQKKYSKDLPLPPSTTYRIGIRAVNGRDELCEGIAYTRVSVPGAVGFLSKEEPLVKNNGSLIEIKIPEVVNATKNTTIKVIVKGLSTCNPHNSLPHLNETKLVKKWEAAVYEVEEKRFDESPLMINTKQHHGVDAICSLHREETYTILFVVTDWFTGASSNYTSSQFTLVNHEHGMKLAWSIIFPIVAIGLGLLLVCCRIRRRIAKTPTQPIYLDVLPEPAKPMHFNELSSLENVTSSTAHPGASETRLSAHLYWVLKEPDSHAVSLKYFEEYVKDAAASGLLYSQFMLLPRGLTKPSKYGSMPENIPKNRYKNQIAYDDSRVVLKKLPGNKFSDYINASYIKGFWREKAYIATEGPKPNTINDFWRMIWQEDVRVICMMSNLVEGNTRMSEKYWPDLGTRMKFGNFLISTTNHQVFADFTFRTFRLSCQQDTREVAHLQFTGWPILGVPSPQSFVAYLKKLIQTPSGNGPIVVHCHAGDGRTGIVILSDICLHQAIGENTIDVMAVTTRMRNSRTNMVATPQQYLFAHVIIVESLVSISTQIPCTENFPSGIQQLRLRLKADLQRLRDTMWQEQALDSCPTEDLADADYITIDEIAQVSETSGVPNSDRSQTFEGISSAINVVRVDGLRLKNQYLASWLPPPLKLSNFWEFVAQRNIQLIIILQCSDENNPTCCDIIPDKLILPSMPHLMIDSKTVPERDEHFVTEKLRLTDTTEKITKTQTVTVITCRGWKAGEFGKPPSPVALVSLWRASEKISRKEGETLVLCHDGCSGCSLYLAMCFLLERMTVEGECDVISAVRTVRISDPNFVYSKEQCEYLYDAAEVYAEYFKCYANFT